LMYAHSGWSHPLDMAIQRERWRKSKRKPL
jgi:hypothetical protein